MFDQQKDDASNFDPPVNQSMGGNDSGSVAVEVLPPEASTKGGGPRTAHGKEKSKYNALTHGIFAKVTVLKDESQTEFDLLVDGLREYFRPVGAFEEILVETLAVTRWRQRRVLIAEAAEIEAGKNYMEWDEKERQRISAKEFPPPKHNGGLIKQIANPKALERCLERLAKLKSSIESRGFEREIDRPILDELYGSLDEGHWEHDLYKIYQNYQTGYRDVENQRAKQFLNEIDSEVNRLRSFNEQWKSVEVNRMKLESLRREVPTSHRLDQLLRYSASLDRTFDRTLNQLERAQRIRECRSGAPPINVTVSSS